jgi:D-lactate dehydrogenase
LDQVLAQSDCLTLHAPAMAGTSHLLDEPAFSKVKRGVLIVNTARGALIDTAALLQALRSGQVGGAGLDVLESEELLHLTGSDLTPEAQKVQELVVELQKIPGVLMTPHNAFNSAEAVEQIRSQTVGNILGWHTGHPINLVS